MLALLSNFEGTKRAALAADLERWPPSMVAEAARVCAAQSAPVARAVVTAALRVSLLRIEVAGHLLSGFTAPVLLDADAVERITPALMGMPAALSRSFCQALSQLHAPLTASDMFDLARTLVALRPTATGALAASSVLDAALWVASRSALSADTRRALVLLLLRLCPNEPSATVAQVRVTAEGLAGLDAALHGRFLDVALRLTERDLASARSWLREGLTRLRAIPLSRRVAALAAARAAVPQHPDAPLALLQSSYAIIRQNGVTAWEAWLVTGRAASDYAALAYYRRQSRHSARALAAAGEQLTLEAVRSVLGTYCAALAGQHVELVPGEGSDAGSLRSVERAEPSARVYLPTAVPVRQDRPGAFARYKVMSTHQVAHVEFGTYGFAADRPGRRFRTLRPANLRGGMAGLLALFPEPRLAHTLFVAFEDARVDACALRQYAGLRADYRSAQRAERRGRRQPPPASAPRGALLEALIRLTLGGRLTRVPPPLAAAARVLRRLVRAVEHPDAAVEDVAEATLRAYALFATLSPAPGREIEVTVLHADELPDALSVTAPAEHSEPGADGMPRMPRYRAHEDPQLSEALAQARAADHSGGVPLTPEELRRLLEQGLKDVDMVDDDAPADQGLFVTDLLIKPQLRMRPRSRSQADEEEEAPRRRVSAPASARRFLYDEWDFRAHDYRPQWCQLFERPLDQGSDDVVGAALRAHPGVVSAIRRSLLHLRPRELARRRGLPEGDDLDLDAAIERVVALRGRRAATDRVYWQRQRLVRDVAVAFLLDMSASTDAEVPTARGKQRIIDVEREGLILLCSALEGLGDRYGMFGFSGYGRENVEFYVIKDLDERFSPTIARRLAGVRPLRSTRMGPAIRHATAKLERSGAQTRLLLLLSDGYPQDHDYYGIERTERDYALHDTRVALLEARGRGVVPFCLTVDQAGHDYLRTMCSGLGYEVVHDLANLPQRLATLYARLTH